MPYHNRQLLGDVNSDYANLYSRFGSPITCEEAVLNIKTLKDAMAQGDQSNTDWMTAAGYVVEKLQLWIATNPACQTLVKTTTTTDLANYSTLNQGPTGPLDPTTGTGTGTNTTAAPSMPSWLLPAGLGLGLVILMKSKKDKKKAAVQGLDGPGPFILMGVLAYAVYEGTKKSGVNLSPMQTELMKWNPSFPWSKMTTSEIVTSYDYVFNYEQNEFNPPDALWNSVQAINAKYNIKL